MDDESERGAKRPDGRRQVKYGQVCSVARGSIHTDSSNLGEHIRPVACLAVLIRPMLKSSNVGEHVRSVASLAVLIRN